MSFKENYPDYVSIEEHIRRARIERSLAVGNLVANGLAAIWNFMKKVADSIFNQEAAEHDREAIEANPFLKRSVHR